MSDQNDGENSAIFEQRPWGTFHVLEDTETHKVKRITVAPSNRLSYQRHNHRSEHWVVIRGSARVTLDGFIHMLEVGHAIDIPTGAWHRIENAGEEPLVFIEVQLGDYFGEDDIIRAQDDFGRHDTDIKIDQIEKDSLLVENTVQAETKIDSSKGDCV